MERSRSAVKQRSGAEKLYDLDSVMNTGYPENPASKRRPASGKRSPSERNSGESRERRNSKNTRTAKAARTKGERRLSQPKVKHKPFEKGKGIDVPFLVIVLILLTVGIVMMFSASYPVGFYEDGDSYYYLKRQLVFAAIGLVIMFFVSYVNVNFFNKTWVAVLLLVISYGGLGLALISPTETGVRRWIPLGPLTIQASEVTKLVMIFFFAYFCTKLGEDINSILKGVLPSVAILGTTCVLLYLEPHYSGIVITVLLVAIMLFIGGLAIRWFAISGGLVFAAVAGLWVTGNLSYAMDRLHGWGKALDYTVEGDAIWDIWQTRNSLYAIGSGGFGGLGLTQSRQKYLYLPEPQNDFVFAIVCEELGFIGATLILVVFALLVWRGIKISMRSPGVFSKLLGVGITAQVGLQVILNIFVITDWLPNTGISLPFFSSGGSSLIMMLAQMGLVLAISRSSNLEKS